MRYFIIPMALSMCIMQSFMLLFFIMLSAISISFMAICFLSPADIFIISALAFFMSASVQSILLILLELEAKAGAPAEGLRLAEMTYLGEGSDP